jgi:hypothetical protein
MNFFAMIFIVSILGAIIGVKKPWRGGISVLLIAPFGGYFNTSLDIIPITISILFLFLLGLAYGFMSSMIFSGLKGGRRNVGQTFGSGFGAHHPGGIILSDDEIKILNDKNIKRKVIFSY